MAKYRQIFITGATGFLGKNLIKEMLARGMKFSTFTRKTSNIKWFRKNRINILIGDITDIKSIESAVKGHDAVIHLAGATDISNPLINWKINVEGVKNLISVCEAQNVKRVIHLSTNCAGRKYRDAYGETKLEAEKYFKKSKLNFTILRPTMIYGKGSKEFMTFVNVIRVLPVVPIIGNGKNMLQPVAVDDVINLLLSLVENKRSFRKIYDIAGPKPVTVDELVYAVASTFGLKRSILHLPIKPFLTGARLLGKIINKVPITVDQVMAFIQDTKVNIQNAERDFDFFPKPVNEGLKKIFIPENIKKKNLFSLKMNSSIAPQWFKSEKTTPILFNEINQSKRRGKIAACFSNAIAQYPAIIKNKRGIHFNFNVKKQIDFLLNEEYSNLKPPLNTYLPFHYHLVPGRLRFKILKTMVKYKKKSDFPNWPLDISVDIIKNISSKNNKLFSWPKGKKYAVVLTHDVDTKYGFGKIPEILKIENKYGVFSCWYIVGNHYKLDYDLLDSLKERGHEIGLHGYYHDNKISFLPKEKIIERIKKCLKLIKMYDIQGFRSPSLLNSSNLFNVLGKFFKYDSSVPNVDVYNPFGLARGCCTIFPFRKGKLIEIPLTLPSDDKLLALSYRPLEIYKLWLFLINKIKQVGGIAVVTTHTEPHLSGNSEMINIYSKFLKNISKEKEIWFAKPIDIVNWYLKCEKK